MQDCWSFLASSRALALSSFIENRCMWITGALEQFVDTAYEQSPIVLQRKLFSRPLFSPSDACKILTLLIERNGLGWSANGLRVERLRLPSWHLGDGGQADLERFIDEVCELNGIDEFTISAHNCHALLPELQRKLVPFLGPLFERTGIPSNGVNLMVFGGKYRVTPAGLHNDPCDIFLAPIIGGKRLYTWPWQHFDGNEGREIPINVKSRRIDAPWRDYLGTASLFEPRAGDVLYFPAGRWHVNDYGVAERSFSFGISIFKNLDIARSIASMVASVERSQAGGKRMPCVPKVDLHSLEQSIPLPPTIEAVVNELDEMLRLNVLQRASSVGFVTGLNASNDNTGIGLHGSVRLLEGAKIFCVRCSDNRFAVIANGKVIKTDLDLHSLGVLQRVANGFQVSADELQSAQPGESARCHELMGYLLAQGVLTQQSEVHLQGDTGVI